MEIPVLAPRRGSVTEFRVNEGEPVTVLPRGANAERHRTSVTAG